MKNKPAKIVCAFFLMLCAALGSLTAASAAVYTTTEEAGSAETLFVAGNPDCFPMEYYDSGSKTFRGVIPDMLREISEKTGLSFTYISASSQNRQRELSRNNQVELVTAIDADGSECSVTELLPIFETVTPDGQESYCIGFTEIASAEAVEKIKAACAEITQEERIGYLISNSRDNPAVEAEKNMIWIVAGAALVLLAAAAVAAVLIGRRRKGEAKDSLIDEQTGIGNAKYYAYVFDNLLRPQSRNLYILVYLALDFQNIRGKYGEKAVAEMDEMAAKHLNAAVGSGEYLARMEEGVFALLLQAVTRREGQDKTLGLVNGLNQSLQGLYPEAGGAFVAGVSRLCEHPDGDAESEFYSAKQGYFAALKSGNAVEMTENEYLAQSKKREKLRSLLPNAVKDGEFRVYMQFITEGKSEKICGAEVLSRWQNSLYGTLRPAEYIELLKETGQIVEHDYKVFAALCRQLEMWEQEPFNRLFLTCNFTRISFCEEDFCHRIGKIASGFHFDHNRLVIEVTEDSISEDSAVVSENIHRCREMGFKIAIDDMGTGFSSFADLYDNEIDLVKISSEFIASCTSKRRETMLADIISLAHRSGAKIICEGVETAEQAETLRGMDCDMMQGFYFAKILPLVECKRFLEPGKICEKPVLGM